MDKIEKIDEYLEEIAEIHDRFDEKSLKKIVEIFDKNVLEKDAKSIEKLEQI